MQTPDYSKLSPSEAVALQDELRLQIRLQPYEGPLQTIGGADISFNKFSDTVYAGIVVLAYPTMEVLERHWLRTSATFPYIPGLLAFRELPALLEVWDGLRQKPDILVLDGHGIAHPRRMGIAAHFGVVAGHPAIGCGKTRLTGSFEPPGPEPGSLSRLMLRGAHIGDVLRTKARCNPVFVSPGHLVSQEQSTAIIQNCVGRYRIPEPTRQAHQLVNEARRGDLGPVEN